MEKAHESIMNGELPEVDELPSSKFPEFEKTITKSVPYFTTDHLKKYYDA